MGGKVLEPSGPLGWLSQAPCFLWPCLMLRWQITRAEGYVWVWAGPLESFLVMLLGLQVPATAHFGVLCSSNPAARMPVPCTADLGTGSSQEKGLGWASKAQGSQAT